MKRRLNFYRLTETVLGLVLTAGLCVALFSKDWPMAQTYTLLLIWFEMLKKSDK
jgi:hypothetical protein